MVKMLPVRSLVQKFRTGMVELILDQFELLGRPREQIGPLEQAGPREWAAQCVTHVGARLGLGLATRWVRGGLRVTWLGLWLWCLGTWMARLGLGPVQVLMARLGPW
ncbi:hypothetical protein ACFX16_007795 [Malus domestica]